MSNSDNLRNRVGQAIAAEIHNGAPDPDWFDSREVDRLANAALRAFGPPIDMILFCPACGVQHIDKEDGDWTNPQHCSHLCAACGSVWRPADVCTNGVADINTHGRRDTIPPVRGAVQQIGLPCGRPDCGLGAASPAPVTASQPVETAALAMLRYVLPYIPPRAIDVAKARIGPMEDAYVNTQVRRFLEDTATPTEAPASQSIPMEAISTLLKWTMGTAVRNGANSISMPDECVAVAHFIAYPHEYGLASVRHITAPASGGEALSENADLVVHRLEQMVNDGECDVEQMKGLAEEALSCARAILAATKSGSVTAPAAKGVPKGFVWPTPPPRKGQSPVLFDDGYEEGWAKCISTLQDMLATEPVKAQNMALQYFLKAAYPVASEINPRGYNWSEAYLDQARVILAAPVAYANGDDLDNMLSDRTATIQSAPSGDRRTALYRGPVSVTAPAAEGVELAAQWHEKQAASWHEEAARYEGNYKAKNLNNKAREHWLNKWVKAQVAEANHCEYATAIRKLPTIPATESVTEDAARNDER